MIVKQEMVAEILRIFPVAWTSEQLAQISAAFGPRKKKTARLQIIRFIDRAAAYSVLFKREDYDQPQVVKAQVQRLARAVSLLRAAINGLGEEAKRQIVVGRLATEKSAETRKPVVAETYSYFPPIENKPFMEPRLMFERMERYARFLEGDIASAQNVFPVTRGTRLIEIQAAHLARSLYLSWLLIFGEKGSTVPGHEFHRVASAVAKLYGLKIGSKTLKKADTDQPYPQVHTFRPKSGTRS